MNKACERDDSESPASPKPAAGAAYGADERFKSSGEGFTRLSEGFDLWTGLLGTNSLHASYAVIGAAWAIFGTADQLFGNLWATLAVFAAVLFVGVTLIVNFAMVRLYQKQCKYSQEHPEKWEREYKVSADPKSPWPYTTAIEKLATAYNWLKLVLPVAAVVFLAVAMLKSLGSSGTSEDVTPVETATGNLMPAYWR